MSQNVERAKAVIRARKLFVQTTDRGRTADEANIAFEHLSKLMETYEITLDEMSFRGEKFISKEIETEHLKRQGVFNTLTAIAAFTDTRTYRVPGEALEYGRKGRGWGVTKRGGMGAVFFGAEQDVEMAEFLFHLIDNSLKSETEKFRKTPEYLAMPKPKKRSAAHSFVEAMAVSLARKLWDLKSEQKKNILAETGNALVFNKMDIVNDEFQKTGVHLSHRRHNTRGVTNAVGGIAGHSAANNVNLSRPVNAPKSNQLAISGY